MAVVTGNDYDHIDIVNGSTQTRHMIKDASARADVADLKSAFIFHDTVVTGAINHTILEWESGLIDDAGTETANENFVRSEYIPVSAGHYLDAYIENLVASNYIRIHKYNGSKQWTSMLVKNAPAKDTVWHDKRQIGSDGYIRISMAKANNLFGLYETETGETLTERINDLNDRLNQADRNIASAENKIETNKGMLVYHDTAITGAINHSNPEWESGTIDDTGTETDNNNFMRTGYIPVNAGYYIDAYIENLVASSYIRIHKYNESKQWTSILTKAAPSKDTVWHDKRKIGAAGYIRISMAKVNNLLGLYEMETGETLTERIDNIGNKVESIDHDIGAAKILTSESSGVLYLADNIIAGHTYYIKNITNPSGIVSMNIGTSVTNPQNAFTEKANTYVVYNGSEIVFIPSVNANYWRVYMNGSGALQIIDATLIDGGLYKLGKEAYPLVRLEFDHELKDVSASVEQIDYSNVTDNTTIMQQVYALFDGLVEDYPSLVTKTDLGEYCEISYPEYANGVETAGTYKVTPAYRTYMYKISGVDATNINTPYAKKKNMLIVGGTHGNELAAPFNTYLIAKNLCQMADENYFKILAAFDVYFVPCLVGYSIIHPSRVNANGVNINRNYPVVDWVESGEGTENYTGPSAGSEFETKLIMKLTSMIRPDVAIDHHNYGITRHWQFYAEIPDEKWLPLMYQGLADCSYAFKKAYPEYFGTGFSLLQKDTGSAPGFMVDSYGTTSNWWKQYGLPICGTIEISYGINYNNGQPTNTVIDLYGSKTFSIGEYTLRNAMLRFADVAMRNQQ